MQEESRLAILKTGRVGTSVDQPAAADVIKVSHVGS